MMPCNSIGFSACSLRESVGIYIQYIRTNGRFNWTHETHHMLLAAFFLAEWSNSYDFGPSGHLFVRIAISVVVSGAAVASTHLPQLTVLLDRVTEELPMCEWFMAPLTRTWDIVA